MYLSIYKLYLSQLQNVFVHEVVGSCPHHYDLELYLANCEEKPFKICKSRKVKRLKCISGEKLSNGYISCKLALDEI